MKKVSKILISLFFIISLFLGFNLATSVSYAEGLDPNTYELGTSSQVDESFVKEYGGKIYAFVGSVAAIIAVISLTYVGIKYITTGSLAQKADYKKDLIPIAIGILVVSSLISILSFIANFATSL